MVRLNAGSASLYRQVANQNIDKNQEGSSLQKSTKLDKIEDIKARISNGTYKIDLNATAKAIATELLGG
jgi:anti-sigma28 factor (negative regulator of flagellin synthesis)